LFSEIGKRSESGSLVGAGELGYLVFGPYIELPAGQYTATFRVDTKAPIQGLIDLDVATDAGTRIVSRKIIDLDRMRRRDLEIEFLLDGSGHRLEVRIHCHEGARLAVSELRISRVDSVSKSNPLTGDD
jgi:hypothetical protein